MALHPVLPYRFPLLLDFLSRFAYPTLNRIQDGAYWRVLVMGDALALVKVTANDASSSLNIEVAAKSGDAPADDIHAAISRILSLDVDHTAFYEFAHSDKALWKIIEPLVGLPELRSASVFEALMETIIEQQIAWVTAQKAQRWLVEWAGNTLLYEGMRYYAFPTPAQIAAAAVDDLTPLKITFKRMALMIDIARQIVSGALDLEALGALPPAEAYQRLLAIKGIGHWTAAVTLERALGYDGWVAHNDVVLQAATNRYFYGGQGRIPAERVIETFARFGRFAGLAARYTMYRWVFEQYPVVEQNRPV